MDSSTTSQPLVIETDRMILRTMRLEDADDLFEYQSRHEIVRWIYWPERTREEVVEALEKVIATGKSDLREDGDYLVLAWELKSAPGIDSALVGKVIGQSNMTLRSLRDKCSDIGWVTHQDFQGNGYAYEATLALMKYAFENFPLHRIVADIDTRNPESGSLAEKLGMRREGEFKDSEFFKGAWCDMWLYAILNHEFVR